MICQPHHDEGEVIYSSVMTIVIIVICACSASVRAQWTQPDANQNINSTNTGNVGVGTTAPSAKLTVSNNTQAAPAAQPGTTVQIVGANGATARLVVDAFGPVVSSIDLRKANNTALNPTAVGFNEILGQITWQGRGANSYNPASRAKIMVAAAENYTDTAQGAFMTFSVAPVGGITSVEAMRIDAAGFIGIGTTAPAYRLDVRSGLINAAGGLCINSICKTDWSQVGSSQWANGSGNINYSSGYVGIGTPTPSSLYKLDVQGGTINSSGGLCINGDCKTAWSQVAGQWANGGGGAISYSSGNVGVGTSSPGSLLEVRKDHGAGTELRVSNANTSGFAGVYLNGGLAQTSGGLLQWNNISGSNNLFVGTGGAAPLYLGTNNTPRLTVLPSTGNVGIGASSPTERLEVDGNLKLTGTGNITAAGTIEGTNVKAKYQDVAEWVDSSEELLAGTVVVLDSAKSNHVIASTSAYDSRVAGVISIQPGIALGEHAEGRVLVATTGRVKVKVDASNGPINIGDLLVTSDKIGLAMKSVALEIGGVRIHRPGTLIGKALEPLDKGTGELLVLLSLQ